MLYSTDYKFFNKAREIAEFSDYQKEHIGCVAVYQRQVISLKCNCNKTHPIQKKYNKYRNLYSIGQEVLPTLHAEINCINQIKHLDIDFSRVKLYVYRIRKDRPFGLSRPCSSCMAAIKDLGIRSIYYTTNDGYVFEHLEKLTSGGVT